MEATTVTFLLDAGDDPTADAALDALGIAMGPAAGVTSTLLDTVDGRLHRAGLRLVAHEHDTTTLVLDGPEIVPARLETTAVPHLVRDLPAGALRDRLDRLVDVRALLPLLRFTADRREGVLLGPEGGVVARVIRSDHIEVVEVDPTTSRPAPLGAVEVHGVLGAERAARRVSGALERLGLTREPGDVVDVLARLRQVELGGRVWSPTVPLDPGMPALEGVRDVLANLAATIEDNWAGTVRHVDPEFLHDLRVAVRRTRAVVGQMRRVLPPDLVDEGRAGFAHLGRLTGPARDLDVYLIEWAGYVDPLGAEAVAALEPVRELLVQRQADAHAALDAAMSEPSATELLAHWRADLAALDAGANPGPHGRRALARVVRRRIERAQSTLVENGRRIDDDTPAERVHDLRKDAKQLRYLLECFGSLLPATPRDRFVRRLKAFQDNLGEHQDAEVHVAVIREIAVELHDAGVPTETLLALGQLTERLEQIRVAARREFAERFAAYDTPATEQALVTALEALDR